MKLVMLQDLLRFYQTVWSFYKVTTEESRRPLMLKELIINQSFHWLGAEWTACVTVWYEVCLSFFELFKVKHQVTLNDQETQQRWKHWGLNLGNRKEVSLRNKVKVKMLLKVRSAPCRSLAAISVWMCEWMRSRSPAEILSIWTKSLK